MESGVEMDPSLMVMLPFKVVQEEMVEATMLETSSGSLASEYMLLLRLQLVQIQRLVCGAIV